MILAVTVPPFFGPVVGWFVDRLGPRWIATIGFVLLAPAIVCFRFVHFDSMGQKALMVALLALVGTGLSLVITPIMADITLSVNQIEADNPGVFGEHGAFANAYGLFNGAYATGTLIGPIWGGFVKANAGWGTMTWSIALLVGLSAIPTMVWCGGAIYKRHREVPA